jgi:hypothetical protein
MTVRAVEWAILQAQRFRIQRQFSEHLGYNGNFENPKSYQEKVQFRKLYGNHEFYALAADKYRVRRYVASKVGEKYLIPLLGAYDRLSPSAFDRLPDAFIVKANHGCKWHEVVTDRNFNAAETIERFNRLCRKRFGWLHGERHYNFIKPKIVIEELLQGNAGGLPWDYCFFCYNGPTGFDYNFAIVSPQGLGAKFTKEWELLDSNVPAEALQPQLHPTNFDEMVRVARGLSADFDFVRVDLYTVGAKVYFGELTCTPAAGYGVITNERRRKMRDEMWHLDAGNPLLYRAPAAYTPKPLASNIGSSLVTS